MPKVCLHAFSDMSQKSLMYRWHSTKKNTYANFRLLFHIRLYRCFLVLVTVCFRCMEKAVIILQNISIVHASEVSRAPSSCRCRSLSESLQVKLINPSHGMSEGLKTDRMLLSLILNHDSTAYMLLSLFSLLWLVLMAIQRPVSRSAPNKTSRPSGSRL